VKHLSEIFISIPLMILLFICGFFLFLPWRKP
jgi:hypothetical protein